MTDDVLQIEALPVMELTAAGDWHVLGHVHDVTLRRVRKGRGFALVGRCERVLLREPGVVLEVERWQTDRVIVRRMA
jgi:hypothetical protein